VSIKLPWFPFYVNDWETDKNVRGMGPVARSYFLILLMVQWREGYIEDSLKSLRRLLVLPCDPVLSIPSIPPGSGSPDDFDIIDYDAVLEQVLQCFEPLSEGRLVNRRLHELRNQQLAQLEAKSKGGKHSCKTLRTKLQDSSKIAPKIARVESESESESELKPLPPTPDNLHPMQYAAHICDELVIPKKGNMETVASVIETLAKSRQSTPSEAHDYLLAKALSAKEKGETVNLFWFRDGKYNITRRSNDSYETAAQRRNREQTELLKRADEASGDLSGAVR
jgi:hypothetical protein